MLSDIPNLGNSDPKISKAAALNIVQHISENKGELAYLIKRLVSGLESGKVSTRTGCYTTLTILLSLHKIDPFELYDLIQKALITNKETTRGERRLIYTARVLGIGSIIRSTPAATLSNDEDFLRAALHDLVDITLKKSHYSLLTLPFLTHFLTDETLTQPTFDAVWETIAPLWKNKKDDKEDDDDDDEEEVSTADEYACKVQLALACKKFTHEEFTCLTDIVKICKSLLASKLQFPDTFLQHFYAFLLQESTENQKQFFTTFLSSIKSTKFNKLCHCIDAAVAANIPCHLIISKELVKMLVGVFVQKDPEFTKKSKHTIQMLLNNWEKIPQKKRKSCLECLFGGEGPNILHEYKVLHPVIFSFFRKLSTEDLDSLKEILSENLNSKIWLRISIVNLQVLGRIAVCNKVSESACFEICQRLLSITLGHEKINLSVEASDGNDESNENIQKCASKALRSILGSRYKFTLMDQLGSYLGENYKTLTSKEETLKLLKDIRKVQKKIKNPHLKCILWSYGLALLLDEAEVLATSAENVKALIDIAKTAEEGNVLMELVQFILDSVLKECMPVFNYEEMFKMLVLEGLVDENIIQVLANVMDVQQDADDIEDDDDDDDEDSSGDGDDDDDDDEEKDGGSTEPPPKKFKALNQEPNSELQMEQPASDGEDDDQDMDQATEEDWKKENEKLAKVFAVMKSVKEEPRTNERRMMRTLKIIETYISRNMKCMEISSLLILLMPAINLLVASLKLKKQPQLATRVIGVIDNLNRVKKFSGCDQVAEGTFATIAEEIYEMSKKKPLRHVKEVLEHSILLVSKCYVMRDSTRGKKEGKRLIKIYLDAVDVANKKLRRRKIVDKSRLNTSRFVRVALEAFSGNWEDCCNKIRDKIEVQGK